MIIWGWRTCESVAGEGHFGCPVCRTQQRYRQLAYNRYFTLYFIPLIPLGRVGEQVECQGCFGRFVPEVLTAFPASQAQEHQPLQQATEPANTLNAPVVEAIVVEGAPPPSRTLSKKIPAIATQPQATVSNPFSGNASNPYASSQSPTQQSLSPQTSSWAITSLILGILSPFFICLFGLSLFTSLGAVICGHLALRDINRSQRQLHGHPSAVAGLVLGYLLLAVSVVGWATFGPNIYRALREPSQLAHNNSGTNEDSLRHGEARAVGSTTSRAGQTPELDDSPTTASNRSSRDGWTPATTPSPIDPPSQSPTNLNVPTGVPPYGFAPPPGYMPPPGYVPPGFMPPPGFVPPPGFMPPGYTPPTYTPPSYTPPSYTPPSRVSQPPTSQPSRAIPGLIPTPSRPTTPSSTPGSSTSRPTTRSTDTTRSTSRSSRPTSPLSVDSLDEIIAVLKKGDSAQLITPLMNLRRIPVESSRQDEVARLLDPLLLTDNSAVRSAALEAVKVWGKPENSSSLLAILDMPDTGDRWPAMEALGKIGGSKAAAQCLADLLPNPNDLLPAKRALEEMGSIAEDAVWPHVGHADLLIHTNACQILGKIGTAKTLDKLKARRREQEIARRVPIDMTIRQLETATRRPQ